MIGKLPNIARSRVLLASLAMLSWGSAWAIVGPARDGAAFADRIVMVLTRGPEGSGFCTGVEVAPRIVLTAAHCLRATANMLVLYRDAAGQPVTIPIAATASHPLYREDAVRRRVISIDLGLIKIAAPLPASFHAAELADAAPPVGATVVAAGFGLAIEGEPKTGGAPRATNLTVSDPVSQVLLWAEDPAHSGAGACSGDSGGPVFAADGGKVVAIVAWTKGEKGHKCGTITQGPLVAPARAWIDSVLTRWGS